MSWVALAFPDKEVSVKTERRTVGEGKRQLLQLGEGWTFHIEHPGRYRIRIQASGLPAFSGRVPRLSLWHTRHLRSFAGRCLSTPENEPATIEFEGLFPAGGYEIRNHARTLRHANGSIRLARNEAIDASQPIAALNRWATDRRGRRWSMRTENRPCRCCWWIGSSGKAPLLTEQERAARDSVFPETEDDPKAWRDSLQRFCRKGLAPTGGQSLRSSALFVLSGQKLKAGESFRAGYRSALGSILVSRRFFLLEEGEPDKNRSQVDDFELASRLSYFLWSSMPDEQLLVAARDGKTKRPLIGWAWSLIA